MSSSPIDTVAEQQPADATGIVQRGLHRQSVHHGYRSPTATLPLPAPLAARDDQLTDLIPPPRRKYVNQSKIDIQGISLAYGRWFVGALPLRDKLKARAIAAMVAKIADVPVAGILSKGRPGALVLPRQMAMLMAHRALNLGAPRISEAFPAFDPWTCRYHIRRAIFRLSFDPEAKEIYEAARHQINARWPESLP